MHDNHKTTGIHVENYIVRIYRRDADDPEGVVGTVECVETQIQQPFHGIGRLGMLLSGTAQVSADQSGTTFTTTTHRSKDNTN